MRECICGWGFGFLLGASFDGYARGEVLVPAEITTARWHRIGGPEIAADLGCGRRGGGFVVLGRGAGGVAGIEANVWVGDLNVELVGVSKCSRGCFDESLRQGYD